MAKTNVHERDADYYTKKVERDVAKNLSIDDYSEKQKFALTCQYLGMEGHG